jgi:hypothetical protein
VRFLQRGQITGNGLVAAGAFQDALLGAPGFAYECLCADTGQAQQNVSRDRARGNSGLHTGLHSLSSSQLPTHDG